MIAPTGTESVPQPIQLPADSLSFSWRAVPGAVSYTVDTSDTSDFTPGRVTQYANILATRYTPNALPQPGTTFFWRVRATLGTGIVTAPSEPQAYQHDRRRACLSSPSTRRTAPPTTLKKWSWSGTRSPAQ